jgi:hypothetical protein
MSAPQIQIRLLADSRYGKAGAVLWLSSEHAEALVVNGRAEVFRPALNTSLTNKPGVHLKGGIDPKGIT